MIEKLLLGYVVSQLPVMANSIGIYEMSTLAHVYGGV